MLLRNKHISPESLDIVPFTINNIEPFKAIEDHPKYHPKDRRYNLYWKERTEECIDGIWGDDSKVEDGKKVGGWRWMPGNMRFYTGYTFIDRLIPGSNTKGMARPDIRCTEWLIFYDLVTCDGFSGMSKDDEWTCFRPIGKMEAGEELSPNEEHLLEKYKPYLVDRSGRWKKYKEAREYLYETKDKPLGKPQWFNTSLNYMLLSTRRLGKSWIVVNGIVLYNFVINGATNIIDLIKQRTKTVTIVGSGVSDKTKEFFDKFESSYEELRTNYGYYEYEDDTPNQMGWFWWKTRGTYNKDNENLTNRVKLEGSSGGYTGPGSNLWRVTYGKSTSKGAGVSQNDAIIEEVGLTPGVEDIHAENTPAQGEEYKYGKSTYIGTGGDFEIIEETRRMFTRPDAFDILPCSNPNIMGGGDTGRFIPAVYRHSKFMDENGNLKGDGLSKALAQEIFERNAKLKADTLQYIRYKASYPLLFEEIFSQVDSNIYPAADLEDRYMEIKDGDLPMSFGKILFTDKDNRNAVWEEDFNADPIMDLNDAIKRTDKKKGLQRSIKGAFIRYESPKISDKERVPNDKNPLYLLFVEPVRNNEGTSFVYAFVWKFFDFGDPYGIQDNIVFEWFGRKDSTDANDATIVDIAEYYNCNIFMESNNDSLVGYCRRKGKLNLLVKRLGYIDGIGDSKSKSKYGFYVSANMNEPLKTVLNDFLREEVDYSERWEDDRIVRTSVSRARKLNSMMLCSQLMAYTDGGNFDAHDGLRLRAIWWKYKKNNEHREIDEKQSEDTKKVIERVRAYKRKSLNRRRR